MEKSGSFKIGIFFEWMKLFLYFLSSDVNLVKMTPFRVSLFFHRMIQSKKHKNGWKIPKNHSKWTAGKRLQNTKKLVPKVFSKASICWTSFGQLLNGVSMKQQTFLFSHAVKLLSGCLESQKTMRLTFLKGFWRLFCCFCNATPTLKLRKVRLP